MSFEKVPVGPDPPREVHAIIEIPQGSSNKYEYKPEMDAIVLDRALYSPLYYPCDYGWIAGTLSEDGDPLDILVFCTHPTFPGCVVTSRPIGSLYMRDEKGLDYKVIAVSSRDPRFAGVERLEDLPPHFLHEVEHFFRVYKELEHKETEVGEWQPVEVTHRVILDSVERARGARVAATGGPAGGHA